MERAVGLLDRAQEVEHAQRVVDVTGPRVRGRRERRVARPHVAPARGRRGERGAVLERQGVQVEQGVLAELLEAGACARDPAGGEPGPGRGCGALGARDVEQGPGGHGGARDLAEPVHLAVGRVDPVREPGGVEGCRVEDPAAVEVGGAHARGEPQEDAWARGRDAVLVQVDLDVGRLRGRGGPGRHEHHDGGDRRSEHRQSPPLCRESHTGHPRASRTCVVPLGAIGVVRPCTRTGRVPIMALALSS